MKKILVIDDEELIIRSLVRLLEKTGYEAYVAKHGQDALVMVEEEHFDLILADIRMPGMNGVETIEAIQDVLDKKKVERIPVIFITGYADADIEHAAKKLKPVAYIYKPFDIKDLVGKIKKVIG